MKRMLKLWVLTTTVFHVNHVWTQKDQLAIDYASTITAAELRSHLQVLASDEYEGRETGKEGQRKAANYLAAYYRGLEIPPQADGSYFQNYPMRQERISGSELEIDGQRFAFIRDFYSFNIPLEHGKWPFDEFVFVGYGIDDPAYSDYKSKPNVRNKTVVCLSGEPMRKDGTYVLSGTKEPGEWSYDFGSKIQAAASRGATCVLIVQPEYDRFIPRVRFWLESPRMMLDYPEGFRETEAGLIPYFFVSARVGDLFTAKAFRKSVKDLNAAWEKKGKAVVKKGKTNGIIHVKREVERTEAHNVLAFIEGSDEHLKHEIVIVSAHYDHIGIVNGEINNGADDDGSGTVTTLEIAQAFALAKSAGHGPRRSILILNVSGEEKGLLGSEWYSEFPVYPLENTVCNLNIDMIGRVDEHHPDDPNYVYLIGSDRLSSDLHRWSEEINATYSGLELDYTYNAEDDPNRFYYRSDHYNFARKGIPVIFYFTGVHEDYHRPGDDTEKIMFEKMEGIARLIFHTAWDVANRDFRPVVDGVISED